MADTGARLTILNGPLAGKELALEAAVDNVLIGSDGSCRFHIPTPGISPIHARIWLDAGGVTVYDTHSPRGLYINDDRVNGQAPLKNGDVLWLGTPGEDEAVMIQVRVPPRSAETAAPAARAASDAEPEVVEETMMMGAPPVPPPKGETDDFAVAESDDADATLYEMAADDVGAPAAPVDGDADATVVEFPKGGLEPIRPPGDADAFAVAAPEDPEATRIVSVVPDDEPVRFSVDLPPAPPPEPLAFEDETAEMTAARRVPESEPETAWSPPPEPPRAPPPPPPVTPYAVRAPVAAATLPPRPATRAPVRPATLPPAPRPATERAPSAAGRNAALAAAAAVVLIGGAFAARTLLQRGAPANETAAPVTQAPAPPSTAPRPVPPPTQAAPAADSMLEPPLEEAVTIVSSASPTTLPAVTGTPSVQPPAVEKAATAPAPPTTLSPELARSQQVAALLGRAETAAAAWDYAGASATFDEVLKLDPSNARATDGRAQAQAALAALRKGFVASRTTVTGGKAAKGGLSGFDSEDVSVAKALDYSGRIDFEASPRSVKPGDSFNVQVYLTNDGKKGFKIGNVTVTTAINGARSGGPAPVRERDVEPGARVLLAELPGTWQATTASWSLDVVVASSRNDTFRSQLTWR